jgi:hypothetical protein
MADPVNWSKLRKQAIDLVALDLPSNWAALRHVLIVLTGALIFFGCALAAVLKTHTVYTVPGLLPDPAPAHPVPIVSKDIVTPAPMPKPASPADVRVDARPSPDRQPTEPVSLTSSEIKTSKTNRVPECATPGRMMRYLKARNPELDPRYAGVATEYMRLGEA